MELWPSVLGTTAVVAFYLLTFLAVLKTDQLPIVPKPEHQQGLNVSEAWKDLHVISTRPHPYSSHANDLVHAHLLARLAPIAATYPHVHIVEDRVSNASYEQIYFEGTNILVKVDGTSGDQLGAVLFSAHYDSVSTSNGATDDGMAIVSMLQLVAKLAKVRSKRTAIFNFNNGEEDGLNGAHVFLQHPWSNLTETFLNLEGASSGGRPILFRGTSTKPLSAFHHKHVPHPHGTVLAADAFAAGIIRSRTDYSVYAEGGGMQGLDLAFYKGRSYYHTKFDAIPYIRGGTRALWSMMEALDGAGRALLDQDSSEPSGDVVYFDLFGGTMVMFSLAAMQTFNVVLLVIVPVVVSGLFLWRRLRETRGNHSGILQRVWRWEGKSYRWARFWAGLIAVMVSQVALVLGYVASNKYVVYSSPYVVLGSAISLAYLAFSVSITPPSWLSPDAQSAPTPNLNNLLLQFVVFTYSLLLATAIFLPIGGTYIFTALATCAFLGWLAGAAVEVANQREQAGYNDNTSEGREDVEPSESTPLISHSSFRSTAAGGKQHSIWFLQLALVVPVPVILISHIGVLLVGAMPQGIVDGGPVWFVYAALSLIATLLILPVAPFIASYPHAPPLHLVRPLQRANSPKTLSYVLLIVFGVTVAYTTGYLGIILSPTASPVTRLGFPFSIDAPMKVFFQQQVEVIAPWVTEESHDAIDIKTQTITYLTGIPHYLDTMIVPSLPSALNHGTECVEDDDRKALVRCGWPSGDDMLPFPGQGAVVSEGKKETGALILSDNPWLRSSIHRSSTSTRRIRIGGSNTRVCRIYFDNAKVAQWSVVGGSPGLQKGYKGFETTNGRGLTELRLWSRTWDRDFVVDVVFIDAPPKVKGRVACEWAEYESGQVGLSNLTSTIPAYEEALRFFPRWATLTKLTDGLVEVWSAFET
ncbi:hypothetical protein DXG01_004252 [Tephrocybe rancida]|nr:hypothetical protein DXG01_004252 [Tephrocybe rancida]